MDIQDLLLAQIKDLQTALNLHRDKLEGVQINYAELLGRIQENIKDIAEEIGKQDIKIEKNTEALRKLLSIVDQLQKVTSDLKEGMDHHVEGDQSRKARKEDKKFNNKALIISTILSSISLIGWIVSFIMSLKDGNPPSSP